MTTSRLVFSVVADGPSDRCLVRVLEWYCSTLPSLEASSLVFQFASFEIERPRPKGLRHKLESACRLFPSDLVFIHRDAENQDPHLRTEEIREAATAAGISAHVPIVPVRMTEAWLLIDEAAIRSAADNPAGTTVIHLPPLAQIESLPDPKDCLRRLILKASGKTGRRLASLKRDLPARVHRVASYITDFSPLRKLSAFQEFERLAATAIEALILKKTGQKDPVVPT